MVQEGSTPTARRRGIAILVAASMTLAAGCGDDDTMAANPPPAACTLQLASDPAYDLVVNGSGACAGSVRLALRVATGDASEPTWITVAQTPLRIEGQWELGSAGVTRSMAVSNAGTVPINFVGLEWTAADLGVSVDRLLHNGYQGSSYTGIEPIPDALVEEHGTIRHAGDDENSQAEIPGVSWWVTALSNADGRGLVVGADGATVLKTYVGADGNGRRLRVVVGVTGDTILLNPGERRSLDGLFLTLGDVRRGLDAYAQRVATLHPPVTLRRRPLGGWGSWNLYYLFLRASQIRMEMAWAHDHLVPAGLSDFLLDDGYMPYWGQWVAAGRFGADLTALSAEEESLGLNPSIWVAPMYVSTVHPVTAAHPEWFLHTAGGQMRLYSQVGRGDFATLDISSSDAREFIVTQLQALWTAGYRSFKLDFLYAAAIEGVHQQPLTALEFYQSWMRLLRDTLPDAHILGAGAPVLPSVGWVDSMRTGSDIAFFEMPTPHYGFYAAEARQTILRSFTDAWWAIDPDVILLRGDAIDDVDAWSSVVAGALAGGNYLLGDGRQAGDLRARMAIDPEILALHDGVAARPRDLMQETDAHLTPIPALDPDGNTAVPHVWEKRSADRQRQWLAVFAWRADPYSVDLDLPHGALEILPPTFAGGTSTTAPIEGRRAIEVARHALRLFRWRPS